MNDLFVQIKGPFIAGQELLNNPSSYAKHIGIQAKEGTACKIDGQDFIIGNREILEFDEVQVTSLKFNQDVDAGTLVDLVLN